MSAAKKEDVKFKNAKVEGTLDREDAVEMKTPTKPKRKSSSKTPTTNSPPKKWELRSSSKKKKESLNDSYISTNSDNLNEADKSLNEAGKSGNEANQSYVMSDIDDSADEADDDSPDCPEIQKFIREEKTMQGRLELCQKELLLVDETPEERKEIDLHPERPILTMRNTSSSNIMHGLIAGWMKEIKALPKKEPDIIFRHLLALSLSMFRDDHWICDNDSPDVVCSLVKDLGLLWRNLFKKSDEQLNITDALRSEVNEIFKYYKKLLVEMSEDWDHRIDFIYAI